MRRGALVGLVAWAGCGPSTEAARIDQPVPSVSSGDPVSAAAAPKSGPALPTKEPTAAASGPAPPVPAAPLPAWWCTCYSRTGPEPMTACRQTLEDCQRLEDGALYGGIAGIVDGSLTHVCREVRGEHPGDVLGGRERWERSKKAGSWVSFGSCRLEGPADASPWSGARDFEHHRIVFGGLRLGQTPAEVEAILGPPPFPARPVEDDHYIYWLEWDYSSGWGLELKFRGPKKSGPFKLDYIRATAPCTFRTEKGIGIGDHESAPGKVYVNPHDYLDAEPGELPDLGPDWTHVPNFHSDPDTHLITEIIIDADGC